MGTWGAAFSGWAIARIRLRLPVLPCLRHRRIQQLRYSRPLTKRELASAARVGQQRQQATGSEHASSIYTLGPAYTYTDSVTQNKPTTVDPNNTTGYYSPKTAPLDAPPIPMGTQLAGEAHSHPDQVGFSGQDIDRAQLLTLPSLRLPRFESSFLGLPDGTVMKYDPRKPAGQRVTVFKKGQP